MSGSAPLTSGPGNFRSPICSTLRCSRRSRQRSSPLCCTSYPSPPRGGRRREASEKSATHLRTLAAGLGFKVCTRSLSAINLLNFQDERTEVPCQECRASKKTLKFRRQTSTTVVIVYDKILCISSKKTAPPPKPSTRIYLLQKKDSASAMKFPDGSTTPADLLHAKKAILTGVNRRSMATESRAAARNRRVIRRHLHLKVYFFC